MFTGKNATLSQFFLFKSGPLHWQKEEPFVLLKHSCSDGHALLIGTLKPLGLEALSPRQVPCRRTKHVNKDGLQSPVHILSVIIEMKSCHHK